MKGHFGVFNSSKKRMKNFQVHFLEELKKTKRHFEIHWPLIESKAYEFFHNFWTNFVDSIHCVENKAAADTVTATWELLSVAFISWYKTWNQCQKCLNFLEKQWSELNYPFIQKPKFQILSLFFHCLLSPFILQSKGTSMSFYPNFISILSDAFISWYKTWNQSSISWKFPRSELSIHANTKVLNSWLVQEQCAVSSPQVKNIPHFS